MLILIVLVGLAILGWHGMLMLFVTVVLGAVVVVGIVGAIAAVGTLAFVILWFLEELVRWIWIGCPSKEEWAKHAWVPRFLQD
jgi:hypothetical protein